MFKIRVSFFWAKHKMYSKQRLKTDFSHFFRQMYQFVNYEKVARTNIGLYIYMYIYAAMSYYACIYVLFI